MVCVFDSLDLTRIIFRCWIRAFNTSINLESHLRILESYLNEYKHSNLTRDAQSISNKKWRYIIGSCFQKMRRRAFQWTSLYKIGNLTSLTQLKGFKIQSGVTAFPDRRLSELLNTVIEEGKETFGEWLMTFHPTKHLGKWSLKTFLVLASGSSEYEFDSNIANTFLDLLVSSLYAYLCFMKQLFRVKNRRNFDRMKKNRNMKKLINL